MLDALNGLGLWRSARSRNANWPGRCLHLFLRVRILRGLRLRPPPPPAPRHGPAGALPAAGL